MGRCTRYIICLSNFIWTAQAQNKDGPEDEEEAGGADMDLEDMEESDDEPLEDEAEDEDGQEGLPQPVSQSCI